MLTSRRDYIMRIIDEVSRILARVVFKRRDGADQEALESVLGGFERLCQLDGDKLFQLTPDQHYAMLADEEVLEIARDKILLYAALAAEAGLIYDHMGKPEQARATRITALRFVLKAQLNYSSDNLPIYAPNRASLLKAVAGSPLDPTTAALLAQIQEKA
jgi:hypothetical protein